MSTRSHGCWFGGRSWGWVSVATCLVLMATVAVAGHGDTIGKAPVNVSVLQNAADRVVVQFEMGDFTQRTVEIDGEEFTVLSLAGEAPLKEPGAPALPHVARSVIVPDHGAIEVKLLDAGYYDINDIQIAPSKGYISRQIDPQSVPYAFGDAYTTDAFYPATLVRPTTPYILRDYRGLTLDIQPFQYNPVTNTLRVYTDVVVEVTAAAKTLGTNELMRNRADHVLSLAFHEVYQQHFINYAPEARYVPMDEQGEMLVICNDAWMPNAQPFVDHKNAIGVPTTMVSISTIGNNTTAIKNYIQNLYNSPTDLAFVLLIGDHAQITSMTSVYSGASDPSFTLLAGGDNYPEIMIGRFSAENAAQVDTQVLRTIEYEQGYASLQPWFWRGTGIASNQGTGDDGEYDNQHMDNIRTDLLAYGYTQVDQIYDPSASSSQVTTALNAGRGIVNYCGHGSMTSWGSSGFSNSNINALTNDNMLPFIVSVACNNGEFDSGTCFGEAWLRATNGTEPTGAVGFYGSSVTQPWDPPMEGQDEFNLEYCAAAYKTYGAYCFAGSCSMMDKYPGSASSWGTGPATFLTWHIFGDPSLRITGIVEPPTGLKVDPRDDLVAGGNHGGMIAPSSIDYVLENKNDTPMDYEVTADVPWINISNSSGTIPGGGTVTCTVAFNVWAKWLDNGLYNGTLYFTNLTDHDGDATRLIELNMGVPAPQMVWGLDSDPGWSCTGLWAWGQPTGSGGAQGYPDPTSGYTGDYVYGYNLAGDYESLMPERHLTTPALDCSVLSDVSLKFWRWLGVEQSVYDHAYVRVSTDGTTWTNVWQNTTQVSDNAWTQQSYDLSDIADYQPTVYLRWTLGPTDGSWQFCGWNIDDIELWGLAPAGSSYDAGDMNCDGTVDFADINAFVMVMTDPDAFGATYDCNIYLADINTDGVVDFEDINPFVSLLTN